MTLVSPWDLNQRPRDVSISSLAHRVYLAQQENPDVFRTSRKNRTWTNVMLGVAGGLAGAWLMNQSQTTMDRSAGPVANGADTAGHSGKKKIAEPVMHYAFGALAGGLYGGLMAEAPLATFGGGSLYGAAVGLVAEQIAAPALGLSAPPVWRPLSRHLRTLGTNLVYGLAAESLRRAGAKLAR
jgi:putative membrane protein